MPKRSKVVLYEQIRKAHERDGLSIHELARRFYVHRRTVREALTSPVPPERKVAARPAPVLGPWKETVDSWLEADRAAPRKQRHTARRVWQRLTEEHGVSIAESTVHRYEPNWLVESADDAARAVEESGGSVVTAPLDIPVGRVAVVTDPFGNVLVLLDLSKGRYATDDEGTVPGLDSGSKPAIGGARLDTDLAGEQLPRGARQVDVAGVVQARATCGHVDVCKVTGIELRQPGPADVDAIMEFLRDERVAKWWAGYSRHRLETVLGRTMAYGVPTWTVVRGGAVIGSAHAHVSKPPIKIDVLLGPFEEVHVLRDEVTELVWLALDAASEA